MKRPLTMFTFYVKPDASFTVVDHFQEIRDISGVTDRCYRVLDDYLFENIVIYFWHTSGLDQMDNGIKLAQRT